MGGGCGFGASEEVAGVQNANTGGRRSSLLENRAAWRGVARRGVVRPAPTLEGGALLEGVGLEPQPDNDIQKSNSEVSNNNGATVNLRSWTGTRCGLRRYMPNKYIPVTYS